MTRFLAALCVCLLAVQACARSWFDEEPSWLGSAPKRNTPPNVPALMPRAQSAFGVEVRVTQAGTSPQSSFTHGPTSSMAGGMQGGFFFGVAVKEPPTATRFAPSRLRLQSVVGADGTALPTQPEGFLYTSSWQDDGVNPKWPFLTASFEVEQDGISEEQKGNWSTPFHLSIPLPEKGEAPLDKEIVGRKGMHVRLISVRHAPEEGFWYVRYRVEKRPPEKDATARFPWTHTGDWATNDMKQVTMYDQNELRGEGQLEVSQGRNAPLAFEWNGALIESSRAWRDESKFQILSFRVPVAPVIQKLRFVEPHLQNFPVPGGTLQLEILRQSAEVTYGGSKDKWLAGIFWLAPNKNVRFQNIRAPFGKAQILSHTSQSFWRYDGTPAPLRGSYFDIQGDAPPISTLKLQGEAILGPKTKTFSVELPVEPFVKPKR